MKAGRLFPLLLAAGCGAGAVSGDDSEVAEPPEPPALVFEGKPDGRYVGVWRTTDGTSTLDMKAGGALKLITKARTPGGGHEEEKKGEWRLSKGKLLFQTDGSVAGYGAEIAGDKLTLARGSKIRIVYRRVKG